MIEDALRLLSYCTGDEADHVFCLFSKAHHEDGEAVVVCTTKGGLASPI